jgi:hypothetical protein
VGTPHSVAAGILRTRAMARDCLAMPCEGRGSPMSSFSYSIDIKRIQNLLETSIDETERQKIQKLLDEEKFKATSRASEPNKK